AQKDIKIISNKDDVLIDGVKNQLKNNVASNESVKINRERLFKINQDILDFKNTNEYKGFISEAKSGFSFIKNMNWDEPSVQI
ncbi:hypothetical protein ABTO03_19220, partial [Acinetobacter baumannii]